jgi:hypothetical protein
MAALEQSSTLMEIARYEYTSFIQSPLQKILTSLAL